MQRLELTWIGKGDEPAVEPRILLHDPTKDYGDPNAENMLIHGDNLLALKALEQQFAGQVKCIYIDPPFNTGQAYENYDDNLEMSTWLNLMKNRLQSLHTLLSSEGTIFVHIDDGYLPYLTLLMDEVFGRKNRLYIITFKQASATGHKAINPGVVNITNFILIYARKKSCWKPNRVFTNRGERDKRYGNYITNIDAPFTQWNITTLTDAFAQHIGVTQSEARKIMKNNPQQIDDFVLKHSDSVIQLVNPDYNSVGAETKALIDQSRECTDAFFKLERDGYSDIILLGGKRIIFYKDKLKLVDGEYVTGDPLTSLWDDILSNNLHNEGDVTFPKGKKPEALIKRCLEIASIPGDIVLDSFLGSGTTAAASHKMKRRWIGIELGEHCYTHCKPRLDKVIDGEQGGISKVVDWHGGGGYKFYELAPSLIEKDKYGNPVISDKYNSAMLVAAVAKLNGYFFAPDPDVFWKQGYSQDKSYIYVTTAYLDAKTLDGLAADVSPMEHLLICAPASETGLSLRYENIQVRKIPQSVLDKCEYGVNDYNLNIVDIPDVDEEDCEDA